MTEKQSSIGGVMLKIIKWAVAVAALVLMIAWTGGTFHTKVQAGKLAVSPGKPLPDGAETYTIEMKSVAPKIDVFGTVTSGEKVRLSARISAYVNKVTASSGTRVKKGQVLIELDDREIKEKLTAARINLKQSKTEYERTLNLYQKNAATEQSLTAAEHRYNSAKSQVAEIKVMLTYTEIKSPIDGVVTERMIEAGDLANPGQVLTSVYDEGNMRLEVPVPVRLIEKLSLNQTVEVTLDRPRRPFKGKVTEIVGEIDPSSRTQKVKVQLNNKERDILPGTFGRVWVREDPHTAVLVPKEAVTMVGQLEMVHVVRNDRVMRRMVKAGRSYGSKVEILSGLSAGEVILVSPLKEG
ncbi:MAG: efflux RND transporter periplasmic adaptor subunit [Deltaproteobacteria bacterium]|nr:efflux RND transporter periplasmic adaptor subunit [Deltaproteobacteria bacterium]